MELASLPNRDNRFWKKVRVGREDECWPWTGAVTRQGYGQVRRYGLLYSTHRYAYRQLRGPIPDGARVENTCMNPACCNPKHLHLALAGASAFPSRVTLRTKGTSDMADLEDQRDPYLTVKEMAEQLGISEEKMRGFIHEGDLPVFRIGSGTSGGIRVRTSAFNAWLRARERAARSA